MIKGYRRPDINGLETDAELELLYKTVQEYEARTIVEIGTLFGLSAAVLAEAGGRKAKVTTIDNFAVQGSDTKPYFYKQVLPKYSNLYIIEADSSTAVKTWDRGIIDFIFIDGNHYDDGIMMDCRDWLPKLRRGGLAAFHDYFNDQFPNVRKRVEEYTGGWKMIAQVDSLIIKQKS